MGLFPFIGVLKPTDQLPLKGFHRDLEEMNRKAIDPFTGRLFLHREQAAADAGEYVEHPGESLAEGEEVEDEVQELRELALDDVPEVPSRRQVEWMRAQAHVLKLQAKASEEQTREGTSDDIVQSSRLPSEELDFARMGLQVLPLRG